MPYLELLEEIKNKNQSETKPADVPFFVYGYRQASYYLTPLFLKANFSPNATTVVGLLVGIFAFYILHFANAAGLFFGIAFYFLAVIIDYADGNIARYQGISNYFGRFIDGVSDIVVQTLLRFGLCIVALNYFHNHGLLWAGVFATALTPFHHLFFDRYSAFARWINESKGTSIRPYIRPELNLQILNKLTDLQLAMLVLSALSFSFALWAYFLISIGQAIFYITVHIWKASQNMNVNEGNDTAHESKPTPAQ